MSYILDALKRADAERERGHVPGLHSQRGTPTAAPAGPRRQRPGAVLVGSVATALLLGAAAWWWLTAPGAETPTTSTPEAPAPLPAPVLAPAPLPAPAAPLTHAPAPALPILAPEPVPTLSQRVVREPATTTAGPGQATAPTPSPAETAATASGASNSNGNVRAFAELTPEIRAQLPQVSVSGSTYSSNPAHRMLIANGKVVQEGEEIAPGLQLESIGPGRAVLNHRGTRFSIGY